MTIRGAELLSADLEDCDEIRIGGSHQSPHAGLGLDLLIAEGIEGRMSESKVEVLAALLPRRIAKRDCVTLLLVLSLHIRFVTPVDRVLCLPVGRNFGARSARSFGAPFSDSLGGGTRRLKAAGETITRRPPLHLTR